MSRKELKVPDLGDFDAIPIIEILVDVGDEVVALRVVQGVALSERHQISGHDLADQEHATTVRHPGARGIARPPVPLA